MRSSIRFQVMVLPLLVMASLPAAIGPAAAQMVKVRMGSSLSPPSIESITPYVALEEGIFKKYGLDVQVVEFRGDATHTKALLSGEIDVTINMGATNGIVAASKGAKIKLWVVPQPITPYVLVARKESARSIQGLAGKTIAVSSIGAISYHVPRIVLERSGVDPEKAKYVVVGSPADRFKALVAGKVDGSVVTTTEAAKLEQYPDIVLLANVPKIVPEIPYEFGLAKEEYIEKNTDTMYKLARAIIEANRWIAHNKAGTVQIARKILPEESAEVLGRAYDLNDPRIFGVNGDLSEASYKFTADFLLRVGHMQNPVPYDKFFDRRFVDRALQDLGRM
jgi:ABC-type nitrate/sulfonate/bicarbonate transport system substrate-binding protein